VRIAIVQLGCPKNLVDGEWMAGRLVRAGHDLGGIDEAEAAIVNTCGFIDAAKEESVQVILELAGRKREGRLRLLVVAGCMVQRYRDELRREIPEIDGFIPLNAVGDVVRLLQEPDLNVPVTPDVALGDAGDARVLATPSHWAYLKIAEGCDNPCTFCAIPSFRGALRSRPPQDLLREAAALAESGVRELILIAQDTTDYGRDLGLENGTARLLEELDGVGGLEWIRLLYAYPNRVTGRLLEAMARSRKVVPYLDLPLQHSHPEILKAMGRGGGAESFLRLLERARAALPGLAVRTSMIVGFPGEKRRHFLHLADFLKEARLDHVGVFAYSREENTAAHGLGDPVDPRTKARRRDALMEVQQEISLSLNEARVGKTLPVMVDGVCEETEHLLQGRLAVQAPEIDGRVLINDGFAQPGTLAKVRISEAHPYDLVGGIL